MFNSLQQQPADKILALMQVYKEDPRENKIDLGVGVYKDASGQTPIMQSIKRSRTYVVGDTGYKVLCWFNRYS